MLKKQCYACKSLDTVFLKRKFFIYIKNSCIDFSREPNLKRSICKCCQTPLIPGETARVRLTSKPIKRVKWTCLTCKNIKRFPMTKGYKLWLDQPEAIIEILDYTPKPRNENIKKSDAPGNEGKKRWI